MSIRNRYFLLLGAGLFTLLIAYLSLGLFVQAQEEPDPTVQAIMNDIILTVTADAQQGGLVATAQAMLTATASAPEAPSAAIDNSTLAVSPFRISNRINSNAITRIAISPDGSIVVGGTDSYDPDTEGSDFLAIWDANSGELLHSFDSSRLPTDMNLHGDITVWDLLFSPDGSLLAIALMGGGSPDEFGDRSKILIWDVTSQTFIRVFHGTGTAAIADMAFSPDGTLLASAQTDGSIRLWVAESAIELAILSGHAERVRAVEFSPDGRYLYSSSDDRTIRVWDMTSGLEVAQLDAGEAVLDIAVYNPTGEIAYIGGSNRSSYIGMWNGQTGQEATRIVEVDSSIEGSVIRFSPDYSIAYLETGDLSAIDMATGEELFFIASDGNIRDVSLSLDGMKVAVASGVIVSVWSLVQ